MKKLIPILIFLISCEKDNGFINNLRPIVLPFEVSTNGIDIREEIREINDWLFPTDAFDCCYDELFWEYESAPILERLGVVLVWDGYLPVAGVAELYWNEGGEILTADVIISEDRREYVIHELGHVLGLAHDEVEESCMRAPPREGCEITEHDRRLFR